MTLKEYFETVVLPSMAERQEAADLYEENYQAVMNSVLADCFEINNAILKNQGEEPLAAVRFYGVDEEIPYALPLLLNCINYGVAARLLVDEAGDDGAVVGYLDSLYQEGKRRYNTGLYESVGDMWGEA